MRTVFALAALTLTLIAAFACSGGASDAPARTPDDDAVSLSKMAATAKQLVRDSLPDPVLRQVSIGPQGEINTFRFTDPKAIVASYMVVVPGAESSPGQSFVVREDPSPLLNVDHPLPELELSALVVGPARVASAATGHWQGCQVRNMILIVWDKALTWYVYCETAQGVVSGTVSGINGAFVPSKAPPVIAPATATPQL